MIGPCYIWILYNYAWVSIFFLFSYVLLHYSLLINVILLCLKGHLAPKFINAENCPEQTPWDLPLLSFINLYQPVWLWFWCCVNKMYLSWVLVSDSHHFLSRERRTFCVRRAWTTWFATWADKKNSRRRRRKQVKNVYCEWTWGHSVEIRGRQRVNGEGHAVQNTIRENLRACKMCCEDKLTACCITDSDLVKSHSGCLQSEHLTLFSAHK